MNMKKIVFILVALIMGAGLQTVAAKSDSIVVVNPNKRQFYDVNEDRTFLNEKVIVKGDTVSVVLPEKNYGRYDRGLFNFLFIPKGQIALGLTANYGSFDSQDMQFLGVIEDFDFKGNIYSVKPTFSYFFRNNESLGLKFTYTKGDADLGHLAVDFDDDINFDIHDVRYTTRTVAGAIFYRKYVGLSSSKRFAVFNDVDLSFGGGRTRFVRYYNDEARDTRTRIFEAALNFSPGVCVFIQDYVSFNVSFGVFGVYFRNAHQTTNDVDDGKRFTSGANFRFNIFNINFGLGIHI